MVYFLVLLPLPVSKVVLILETLMREICYENDTSCSSVDNNNNDNDSKDGDDDVTAIEDNGNVGKVRDRRNKITEYLKEERTRRMS